MSPVSTAAAAALPAHILIVEDEPKMAALVMDYLRAAGHRAEWLHDGRDAVPYVRDHQPDLVLLDLMLPGRDGLEVCRELRTFSDVPVVMLTARVEEADRLAGLECGADDYICKTPFSPREIVARIKAILRRSRIAAPVAAPVDAPIAGAGTASAAPPGPVLRVDVESYRAYFQGALLDLTPVEFRLLRTLASAPGHVFSRDVLLTRLHHDHRAVTDRAVDSHVKNLRRKLAQIDPGCDPIRAVYGVGFRLDL
ncbi:response regulator [Acidovorax sp. Leaf160]|uniref:response regulator n=1 Tax=Acidovorax sp. Leaf160 TaxID=1736280 RepID=UPI0006FE380B|nr:response regulator [Acidovorax sp. Leaf160]KQR45853.1 two-component system response regulator [Acidovorax sp. Leaf160]